MEDHSECMLVLSLRQPEGKKKLIDFLVGVRESAQSWRQLLIDIRRRGLQIAPELASATVRSASGRRSTRSSPVPVTAAGSTRPSPCNNVPSSVQNGMKEALQDFSMAPGRRGARTQSHRRQIRRTIWRAVDCVAKHRDDLLALDDFAAEHSGRRPARLLSWNLDLPSGRGEGGPITRQPGECLVETGSMSGGEPGGSQHVGFHQFAPARPTVRKESI
ncbi:hypothetical protein ABIC08_009245 [Bradyrhizobium sp. RT9b]|uniref:hypothetical protein n=1 Tax=Bradyrhizobium sp. RT9b TaxID=3156385 RepID=UPI003390C62E